MATNDQVISRIDEVELKLEESIGKVAVAEQAERVREELSNVRELVTQLKMRSDEAKGVDLTPINTQCAEIKSGVHTLENTLSERLPKMGSMLTVVAAVVALLGLSYTNVREALAKITNLSAPLTASANEVEDATESITKTIDKLKIAIDEQRASVQSVARLGPQLQSIEAQLLELSAELNTLKIQLRDSRRRTPESSVESDVNIASMLDLIPEGGSTDDPELRAIVGALRALEREDDPEKAISIVDRGLAHADARGRRVLRELQAKAYQRLGKLKEAIGSYLAMLDEDGADPEQSHHANHQVGALYFQWAQKLEGEEKKRKLEKAVSYERKSCELDPKSAASFANALVTLNSLKRFTDSVSRFREYKGIPSASLLAPAAHALLEVDRRAEALALSIECMAFGPQAALRIALDDDLAELRSDERFVAALKSALGDAYDSAARTWEPEQGE